MQVLISGGKKTGNILDALKTRFRSGVDFSVENNISNIGNYYSRGNWFDRAIILEQSWTEDDTIEDEATIRENLHKFVMEVKSRATAFEVIFVVTSIPEMAKIVLEESLDIMAYSKVLLKTPPYYASFFKNLVTDDLHRMPEKYVFDMKKAMELISNEDVSADIMWSTGKEVDDTNISGPLLESAKEAALNIDMKEMEDDTEEGTIDNENINEEMFGEKENEFTGEFDFEELQEMPVDEDTDIEDIGFSGSFEFDDEAEETTIDTEEQLNDVKDTYSEEWNFEVDDIQSDDKLTTFDTIEVEDRDNDRTEEELDNTFEFDAITEDVYEEPIEDTTEDLEDESEGISFDDTEGTEDFNDASNLFSGETGFEDVEHVTVKELKKETEHSNNGDSANKLFNDNYYDNEDEEEKDETPIDYGISFKGIKGKGILSKKRYKAPLNNKNIGKDKDLHIILKTFLKRGNALTVTGSHCSGKTLVASNIANVISKLGYTVLLVDMDTKGRGQSYVTKDVYETVHAGDTAKESLRKAINSSSPEIGRHVDIIRPGFHVLTTALGCVMEPVSEIIQPLKINRFIHSAKTSYNFIIFDIPFDDLTTTMAEILFATDDLIMCVDTTNHGLMDFLLNMGNIESEDVKSTLFSISQILFNKVEKVENVFGYKVKTVRQVLKALDMQMAELIGGEAEYLFKDLKLCGVMRYSSLYEKYWFSKYQISDFADGEQLFLEILRKVLVKN